MGCLENSASVRQHLWALQTSNKSYDDMVSNGIVIYDFTRTLMGGEILSGGRRCVLSLY